MTFTPTAEQQGARDVFASGHDLALVAGAGTGKTTTLALMASATRRRGLYMAFGKSAATDAAAKFGANVECRTAHSLAFQAVGFRYRDRMNSPRLPARQVAAALGITRDLDIDGKPIRVWHQARLVTGMIRGFCLSADREVMARHLERVNGLDEQGQTFLARHLLPYARRAWEDIRATRGSLRFTHDHYLKMWSMTSPTLPGEFILLDEAQDTNPPVEGVFMAQSAQRVCVGDPAQQIYAWRNARDVISGFPAEHLPLTGSFRFGPVIAEVANRWLRHAKYEMRLAGHGSADSRLGVLPTPDAVLCRGNADAMNEVTAFLEQGLPVALAGGGDALTKIAVAAQELKAGKRTTHPELFLFTTWGEVQSYVEQDKAGQDLKAIVQLVDDYGPDAILTAVNRLVPEGAARVTVSTAHKAKGREWNRVRIGEGFTEPMVDDHGIRQPLNTAEAQLIYVAVTRARQVLDTTTLAWIEDYEKSQTAAGRSTGVAGISMIDLPLTGQLRFDSSPISQFFTMHLPEASAVVADYQRRIRGLPTPVQPIDVPRVDWSALGHAIDYLLRLSLDGGLGEAVNYGVEAFGSPLWRSTSRLLPETCTALHTAGARLLDAITAHQAGRGATLDQDTLSRLCFVAAFFEDVFRTGTIRRISMLANAQPTTTLEQLLAEVPDYVPADLEEQLHLARTPFAAFRKLPRTARICGPVFAGSADTGGADADVILDGLLLDCKATIRPWQLGREEIYQLAGYLLLDYPDQFHIDQVGLYLSRQGATVDWGVQPFLDMLGARQPLPALRALLCEHLQKTRAGTATPEGSA